MTDPRMTRLAVLMSLVATAGAQAQVADSTAIRGAASMGTSVCPNLTARTDLNRQFYKTVPTDYYKEAGTGNCLPTGSCTWGLNATSDGCAAAPAPPACPAGSVWNTSLGACQVVAPPVPPLYDCPSSIWLATNGPRIPLADANPAMLAPDGHQWCYYYGRGMAGGGDDGGDPWAGAFDRVVGKAVTYYPLWQEQYFGKYTYAPCDSGDGGQCYGPWYGLGWGLADASAFKGAVPIYGAPSAYSTVNATIGGSKCAPPRPAGTAANNGAGYWQAWYPSDCKGHGDNGLIVVLGAGGYIGGGFCLYDTAAGSPSAARGYSRIQIGGAIVAGGPGPYADQQSGGMFVRGSYPVLGCQPGVWTGSSVDPNPPAPPPPPPDNGGGA
jgi:hypothetical protein